MTHDDYIDVIEKDKKYVKDQLAFWQSKLAEATEAVKTWERQEEAISAVSMRLTYENRSAFGEKEGDSSE